MLVIFAAIALLISDLPFKEKEPEKVWRVKNESRLAIHGHSNVNAFSCKVDQYYSADNLQLYSFNDMPYHFSPNEIVISLMEFDCGRKLITRDFRESLDAGRNPEMLIRFLALDRIPVDQPSLNDEKITGSLKVAIAGVEKEIIIMFTTSGNGNGVVYLDGSHTFMFSDFGLAPPTKMLGLIHVENELEVTFNLVLEELH
jgi:hypothetical protein